MAYLRNFIAVLTLGLVVLMPASMAMAATSQVTLIPHPFVRLDPVSSRAQAYVSTAPSGNYATYSVIYTVTAVGSTLYVPATASINPNSGAVYTVVGSPAFYGVQVAGLTSTAPRFGNYYVVSRGESRTFTLTVSLYTTVPGSYSVELTKIGYAKVPNGMIASDTAARFVGDQLFRTNSVAIATAPLPASARFDTVGGSSATTTTVLGGSATGVTSLTVIIYNSGNADNWVYRNNAVAVTNGRWTVPVQLAPGSYTIEAHRSTSTPGSATLLTSGNFIVPPPTTTTPSTATSTAPTTPTTITSIPPVAPPPPPLPPVAPPPPPLPPVPPPTAPSSNASTTPTTTTNTVASRMPVIIGVYEGSYPPGVQHSYGFHPEGTVMVTLQGSPTQPAQPLVLTAYEPVNWVINNPNQVPITKIIATGYYQQRVTNAPAPVTYYSQQAGTGYAYTYAYRDANYMNLVNGLSAYFGWYDSGVFYGGYTGSSINAFVGYKG